MRTIVPTVALTVALALPTFAQADASLSLTGSLTPGGVGSVAVSSSLNGDVFLLVDLAPGKTVFSTDYEALTIGLPSTFLAIPVGRTNEAGMFGMTIPGPGIPAEDVGMFTFSLYVQALVVTPKPLADDASFSTTLALSEVRSISVAVPMPE